MKSSIAVKLPTNFELRVELTGTGSLDFRTFRVNVLPTRFEVVVEVLGRKHVLKSTHNKVIHIRNVDSKLYIGDGVTWQDSMYTSEISVQNTVGIIGPLNVVRMTALELDDAYNSPIPATVGRTRLDAAWEVFATEFSELGYVDTEYANIGNGIAVTETGLKCRTVPFDLRGDFCLTFTLADIVVVGTATILSQSGLTVSLTDELLSVIVGGVTITNPIGDAANVRVIIDRYGDNVHVYCNDHGTSFTSAESIAPAQEATWFGAGSLTCVASDLAFIPRSVLAGVPPAAGRISTIYESPLFNLVGDVSRSWLRNADPIDVDREIESGAVAFGFRVLREGDFDILAGILRTHNGSLYCGDSVLIPYTVGTDIRATLLFGEINTVEVDGIVAQFDTNHVKGVWTSSAIEMFSFAGFPYGVTYFPPLRASDSQLQVTSQGTDKRVRQVKYNRPGYASRTFDAYVDNVTPDGPWVLLLNWGRAPTGQLVLADDVFSDEITTNSYTEQGSMPVIPSGLKLSVAKTLHVSVNPQWVAEVGEYVITENRQLNGGVIGREGLSAYNERRGNFKLYGVEAGWYSGSSGAAGNPRKNYGFMTTIGNSGLCGGAGVCGAAACPAFISDQSNGCHYDNSGSKQVYVQATQHARIFLHDTSEYPTNRLLPDLGGSRAYSSTAKHSLIALVPGSVAALMQAVGVTGTVLEDNVGWIKLGTAERYLYVSKRPVQFGITELPERIDIHVDGAPFTVRNLLSTEENDEWRDIMFALNGSDDSRGVLRKFDDEYIGLTRNGVPQVTRLEDKAFLGLNDELTLEELEDVDVDLVGWRPVLEQVHTIFFLKEAHLGSDRIGVESLGGSIRPLGGNRYAADFRGGAKLTCTMPNTVYKGIGNKVGCYRKFSFELSLITGGLERQEHVLYLVGDNNDAFTFIMSLGNHSRRVSVAYRTNGEAFDYSKPMHTYPLVNLYSGGIMLYSIEFVGNEIVFKLNGNEDGRYPIGATNLHTVRLNPAVAGGPLSAQFTTLTDIRAELFAEEHQEGTNS